MRCGVLLVANCYHSHNNDCYILNISESCYHSSALHHRKIERERGREPGGSSLRPEATANTSAEEGELVCVVLSSKLQVCVTLSD